MLNPPEEIRYIIQYHTSYHLLMALSEVDFEGGLGRLLLLGPENEFTAPLVGRGATHVVADCRGVTDIRSLLPSRAACGVDIISPFIFPYFAVRLCRQRNLYVRRFVRTDEGVGSFSDFFHIYHSIHNASKVRKSRVRAFVYTILFQLHKFYVDVVFKPRNQFVFNKDGSVSEPKRKRVVSNLSIFPENHTLDGKCVFVSQPFLWRNFADDAEFIDFLKRVGGLLSAGRPFAVKPHRDDDFDYHGAGFSVAEGGALETFSLMNSVVFGAGSTALLSAKLFRNCEDVYFVPLDVGYGGLSGFCKQLFKENLRCVKEW